MHFAAGRNLNASVGLGAEGLTRGAELDARGAILVQNVVGLAIATLVEGSQVVGLVIVVAAFDGRQASLVVISGSVSGSAKRADLVDVVNGGTVRDDANALEIVGADEVLVDAGGAASP